MLKTGAKLVQELISAETMSGLARIDKISVWCSKQVPNILGFLLAGGNGKIRKFREISGKIPGNYRDFPLFPGKYESYQGLGHVCSKFFLSL